MITESGSSVPSSTITFPDRNKDLGMVSVGGRLGGVLGMVEVLPVDDGFPLPPGDCALNR
jgi:hypothetical protein